MNMRFWKQQVKLAFFQEKELVPITPKDLHMKVEYRGLPIAVVIEGKVQKA